MSSAGLTRPKRLDRRHLARHVRRAIARRLGYAWPRALESIERDGPDVVLQLNSGGNAIEAETALRNHGYDAEIGGGCTVRVKGPARA